MLCLLASSQCVFAHAATAQTAGRQLFGARDFEMEWRVEPQGKQMRVRFLATARRVRVEALDGSGEAMVKDLARGDVIVLVDEGRKGVYTARAAPMGAFSGAPSENMREIAGEKCRDFVMDGGTYCLSQDGIPLVVQQSGQTMTAQRVLRQAQNPALFAPPRDAKPKPMPGRDASSMPKLPF